MLMSLSARLVSKKQVIDGKTVYPINDEYEAMFQEYLKQKCLKKEKTA
ncbi:hypothetical protein Osc1_14670 [Hominimerdicola sp. 21CYCFAH17_S]